MPEPVRPTSVESALSLIVAVIAPVVKASRTLAWATVILSLIVTADADSPVMPDDWKAVKAFAYVLDAITALPAVEVTPLTTTVISVAPR